MTRRELLYTALTPAFAQSDKPADSNSSEMKSTAQPAPAVNDSNAKSSAGQSSADKSSAGMSDSAANKAGFVQGVALLVVTFLHYEVGP